MEFNSILVVEAPLWVVGRGMYRGTGVVRSRVTNLATFIFDNLHECSILLLPKAFSLIFLYFSYKILLQDFVDR